MKGSRLRQDGCRKNTSTYLVLKTISMAFPPTLVRHVQLQMRLIVSFRSVETIGLVKVVSML